MTSGSVRLLWVTAFSVLTFFSARGEKEGLSREQAEALVSGLKYQRGEITLQNGLATLHVPEGFQFLNSSDAQTVLVNLWGNPPHSTDPLGLLMPADISPLSQDSWVAVRPLSLKTVKNITAKLPWSVTGGPWAL